MFPLVAWLLLLAHTAEVRFEPTQVTPGKDSYTISVPSLAGQEIDLRFRLDGGPPQELSPFCRLDAEGRAVILVPSGTPPGLVAVIGVRRSGSPAWSPAEGLILVLPEYAETPGSTRPRARSAPPAGPRPSPAPEKPLRILWRDLKIWAAALLALLAIFSAGRWLLGLLGGTGKNACPTETAVFAWALGCLAIGGASFLLALSGLVYRGVFFALAFWSAAACRRFLQRQQASATQSGGQPPHSILERACLVLAALYAAIYLVAALAPEVSGDAVTYHLGLIHLYQAHHRMMFYPDNFYASLPQGMGMVYLFCSSLGGYSVARLAHLACLVALAAAIQALGRRLDDFDSGGGTIAAVAVFSSSLVGLTATTAYVDVALTLAVFLAFYAAFLWREFAAPPYLWLAGLSAGLAMSIKPTGVVALAIAVAVMLRPAPLGLGRGRRWRAALLVTLIALAVVAPWLARNWVVYQNPLMPVANRWFPNRHLLPSTEANYLDQLRHPHGFGRNWRDYLTWPWEVTIGGTRLQGFYGPFFLLAPLALLAAKRRAGRWLLVAALIAAAPLAENALSRFLMPALPFLALGIVMGTYALLPIRAANIVLGLAVLVQGVVNLPWVMSLRSQTVHFALNEVPFRAAFRLESEWNYLRRRLEYFPAIEFIETATPPDARVLTFGSAFHQAYTSRLLQLPYVSESAGTMVDTLTKAADPGQAPDTEIRARFPPVRARALLLQQARTGLSSHWSIYEMQVLDAQGQPLPRRELRYTASVNPFQAGAVADGQAFTGWSTRAPVQAGAWFQVDLGQERDVKEIRYTVPTGEGYLLPEVFASLDGNTWIRLQMDFRWVALRPRNWRAEATALLKSKGIDYLLVVNRPQDAYSPLFTNLLGEPEQWGLKEVFRSGEAAVLELAPE